MNTPSLEKLIHYLNQLPGIGPKTAQRLAYHILRASPDYANELATSLREVKLKIKLCQECFSFTEDELCRFCLDPHRSDEFICVVEDPADILGVESSGVFKGRYHVLHGSISPLDGVSPKDLKIRELIDKINQGLEGKRRAIKEVILALDTDLEGDTTVLYLAKILSQFGVKASRIAHGVPMGSDIDYIDFRTLGRAIENRVEI